VDVLFDRENTPHSIIQSSAYLRRRRHAITPSTDNPDMMLTALTNEPMANMLPNEPMEPIEKADPTDPIDMNEFLQPMHNNELLEAMLHLEVVVMG
jgi:hypothetical protein